MTDALKDKFRVASEIASSVPKELREVAFNRALDALLVASSKHNPPPPGAPPVQRRQKPRPSSGTEESSGAGLLADLDRTRYPEIMSARRVLDRALLLLRAARDDHAVDGLGGSQIAAILSDKFRVRTTRQAVTQALEAAADKVDRKRLHGKSVIYRLMHPGDQYLTTGRSEPGGGNGNASPSKGRKKRKKGGGNAATKAVPPLRAGTVARKVPKGRPGGGEMLKALISSSFFTTPRSIAEIQIHCEKKLAHKYGLNELSTPLRRAVQSGLLQRDENAEGQYEYRQP